MLSSDASIELEWCTVIEDHAGIIRSGGCSKRTLLPNGHAIDLGAVTRNLSYAVATIGCDAVSEALLAITDCNDTLGVAIPCNIVNAASDDVVFSCCPSAYCRCMMEKTHTLRSTLSDTVPHSYTSRNITTGNVEA